jgi:hypothetical protein
MGSVIAASSAALKTVLPVKTNRVTNTRGTTVAGLAATGKLDNALGICDGEGRVWGVAAMHQSLFGMIQKAITTAIAVNPDLFLDCPLTHWMLYLWRGRFATRRLFLSGPMPRKVATTRTPPLIFVACHNLRPGNSLMLWHPYLRRRSKNAAVLGRQCVALPMIASSSELYKIPNNSEVF